MTSSLRHLFTLGLATALLAACQASEPAAPTTFGIAVGNVRDIPVSSYQSGIALQRQDSAEIRVRALVGSLQAADYTSSQGTFTRLLVPGFQSTKEVGAPELPLLNRLLALPAGAEPQVEVLSDEWQEYDLAGLGIVHRILPAMPSQPKCGGAAEQAVVCDEAQYNQRVASRPLARLVRLGSLRGVSLARLEIAPVEHLLQEQRMRVHTAVEVRISFPGQPRPYLAGDPAAFLSPYFLPVYRAAGVPESLLLPSRANVDLVTSPVTMVIVTPEQFVSTLQPFVEWKTQKGFRVLLAVLGAPEVGTTKESIRAYLHGLYNGATAEQPAPSFVLFVGDVEQMPTFFEAGDATDRPYCAVDGDLLPEMYYGRFSATSTAQLAAIIDKTLTYEQLSMPDPSFLGRSVLIAGVDSGHAQVWGNGQINYAAQYYFNAAHGQDPAVYLYPASGSASAAIISKVSAGAGYVNYTAHGSETSWADPSFTQSNVNNLQNHGMYPLVVGNCCLTSTYDSPESFAETWLRAQGKGAIGYIGGSNSTYWDEDYWWGVGAGQVVEHPTYEGTGRGAYDGLFHDHGEPEETWFITADALIFAGNLAVMQGGSSRVTYYWNIYNLMGDPSLAPFTRVPDVNPVVHPESFFTTAPVLALTAAPYSYVGLSQHGVLVGAGMADVTGHLDLAITQVLEPGTARLVVTGQNLRPYIADLTVSPPASVTVSPDGIAAGQASSVTLTIIRASGTPWQGLEVWAEGFGYRSETVLTDVAGNATLTIDYPYGPALDLVAKDPAVSYRLFTRPLPVVAAPLAGADLSVSTSFGLSDGFAANLPGTLAASAGVALDGARLFWRLGAGALNVVEGAQATLTPAALGTLVATLAVPGHDVYSESFAVREVKGSLAGSVTMDGAPVAGALLRGQTAAGQPAFEIRSDAAGAFAVPGELPVGPYLVTATAFGAMPFEVELFVNLGANSLPIALVPSVRGALAGRVTEVGTGAPLGATVLVLRADTLQQLASVTTAEGAYRVEGLPYYDYLIKVRAAGHMLLSRPVTVAAAEQVEDFVLELSKGNLLLLADGSASSASLLAADLTELGYLVTSEDATSSNSALWGQYDLLVVSSGRATSTLQSAALRQALVAYVQGSGRLLIEGGEVAYNHRSDSAFAAQVLHVASWHTDRAGDLVYGGGHAMLQLPNGLSGTLGLTYQGYGDSDGVAATADAQVLARWSDNDQAALIAFDDEPGLAGGQSVFYPFAYGSLAAGGRAALLQNTLAWLLP